MSELNAQEFLIAPSPINRYLQQNSITGFGRDNKGYLWLSTQFGLYRYDGVNVKSFFPGADSITGSFRFMYIVPSNNGQLVAANETGFYTLANGKAHPMAMLPGRRMLESGQLLATTPLAGKPWLRNQSQRIWTVQLMIFGNDTLVEQPAGWVHLRSGNMVLPRTEVADNQYRSVRQQVICLNSKGVYQVSYQQGKVQHRLLQAMPGKKIWVANSQDACWFQNNRTLLHLDPATGTILHQLPIPNGDIEQVSAVFADSTANRLFLGTPTAGVVELSLFRGKVLNSFPLPGNEDYVYTYAPHPMGGYLSIAAAGLKHYREQGSPQLLYPGILNRSFVVVDPQGRAWFRIYQGNLIALDLRTKRVVYSFPCDEDIMQLHFTDSQHALVVSQHSIKRLQLPQGRTQTLVSNFAGATIQCALRHRQELWVGTTQGLYRMAKGRKTINQLKGCSVRSLLRLNDTTVAVGTYGYGTFLVTNNRAQPLPQGPNNASAAVVGLALDADSTLWVLCNKGALLWKKEQWQHSQQLQGGPAYFLETRTDLPVNELNGGQTPQLYPGNDVVLPSSRGLVVFNKAVVLKENAPLSLELGPVYIDDKAAPANRALQLQPYHRKLQLQVNAPFFGSANNFGVLYRMKGLDTEWFPLAEKRSLQYERLPPGAYTLQVKTGQYQPATDLLLIEVLPYWYQRPVIVTLLAAALAALLYLAYHTRMVQLRRQQAHLETLVNSKTQELRQTVDKLSRSRKELLQQYRHRNRLYSILMHDLRSPLQFLSVFSIEQWKQNQQQPVPADALKVMAETSTELSGFINQFLDWLGRQNKKQQPAYVPVNISMLASEVVQLYQHVTLLHGNRLLLFCPPDLSFTTDPDLLRTIIRNLIDNANKYTRNGIVKLQCALAGETLVVEVADSGKGLPQNIIDALEKPAAPEKFEPSINASHKLGLQVCRIFIGKLQGKVMVKSKPEEGTTITLHIPALKQHNSQKEKGKI